ncbi:HHR008Wp [Eremothecium sinecaudum]|uniref:HHR008Wp n=1 Tax=Eremothecium sinecaudum TaxID=45286 RepID=A0A0X8HWF7_9SACH|nr:HHR008Wp [Eremothecium sinecaudum]AMD22777.1 HHR008Wp [Eremothecium sinecaudum]
MNVSTASENEYFQYLSKFIYSYVDLSDNTALLMLKFYPDGVHNPYRNPYNYTAQIYSSFLNSTRTGSAQRDYGINLETFLSGVLISFIYCVCQTLLFSCLRTRLPRIYQPNVYLLEHAASPILDSRETKTGVFGWIRATWHLPIESYKKYGLDSFFFLRYLKVLCIYFLILSLVTIPVLIPIHYTSGYKVLDFMNSRAALGNQRQNFESDKLLTQFSLKATGLDEISMSNISPRHFSRLIFHFILGIFAVVWFHATLITELDYFITERNKAILGEDPTAQKQQCAMYLNNIPDKLMSTENRLVQFFHSMIPDSVYQIVFIPKEYRDLKDKNTQEAKLLREIEGVCYDIIKKRFYMKSCPDLVSFMDKDNILPVAVTSSDSSSSWREARATALEEALYDLKITADYKSKMSGRRADRHGFRFGIAKFKYHLKSFIMLDFIFGMRVKWWRIKIAQLDFSLPMIIYDEAYHIDKKLQRLQSIIGQYNRAQKGQKELTVYHAEQERMSSPDGKPALKSKQAVVVFKNALIAHFFDQLLLSDGTNSMKEKILGISPEDIHWKNITVTNRVLLMFRVAASNFLSVMVIVGWVIPVAFVGLISQIPFLAKLVPLPSRSGNTSSIFDKSLASIVPVMTLIFLTECVPFLFRWFGWLKCCRSGSATELDVQKWFFAFLFVHIFLVVTISSGISVIVEKLVNNPVSIPDLLGTNLPKSSNFFCSFILIRGMSYFGGNFMQIKSLLFELFYYRWKTFTPRGVFERNVNIQHYQWGSVYPMFSVLACIGIIYCVISPIILLFSSFSFGLVMFSFKYSIKYQYNPVNKSETFGKYYPMALMQLYAGIYFMEICLIGLFTISNRYRLSLGMIIVIIFTISAHLQIWSNYKYHINHIPAQSAMESIQLTPYNFHIPSLERTSNSVWIPSDERGASNSVQMLLEQKYDIECSQLGCNLDEYGNLVVSGNPP